MVRLLSENVGGINLAITRVTILELCKAFPQEEQEEGELQCDFRFEGKCCPVLKVVWPDRDSCSQVCVCCGKDVGLWMRRSAAEKPTSERKNRKQLDPHIVFGFLILFFSLMVMADGNSKWNCTGGTPSSQVATRATSSQYMYETPSSQSLVP